jgi:N-acyl-D-amino-acid deacylase
VIAGYVREMKVLKLEEAIKKMTSMPANQIKQCNRGHIHKGAYACASELSVFGIVKQQ